MNNFTIKERMGKLSDEELVEELLNASYDYKGSCYQKDKDIYLAHKAELIFRLTAGENLKCCGNCVLYAKLDCPECKVYHTWKTANKSCHVWNFDELTKQEREL